MAQGPGKYDAIATVARETANARGIVLIVLQGDRGSGFSVQASEEMTRQLPKMLRVIADQIEADLTAPPEG